MEQVCRGWCGGCGVQKSHWGMAAALLCTRMPLLLQRGGCSGSSSTAPQIWGFMWAVHPLGLPVRSPQQPPALAQQTVLRKLQLSWESK